VRTVAELSLVPTIAGFSGGKKSEEASGDGDDANHAEFCREQWMFYRKGEVLEM